MCLKSENCDTRDCCIYFATQLVPRSLDILSYLQNVCRDQGVKKPKIGQICLFSKFLIKSVNSTKNLRLVCFLHIYRNSTKSIFSESFKSFDYICRSQGVNIPENGQICTKTGYTNIFATGNPLRHLHIMFFL